MLLTRKNLKTTVLSWGTPAAFIALASLSGCGGGSSGPSLPSGLIVFDSDRDAPTNYQEIYIMNADGKQQRRLTNSPANDFYPALSPDRTKIVFASAGREGDPAGSAQLYVMNVDGTGLRRLTNSSHSNLLPQWSPDGSKITFISNRTLNSEVYVVNADGTNEANLTNNPAGDNNPTFSPDGSKILFTSSRNTGPRGSDKAWIMNSDGSNPTPIPLGGPTAVNRPQFSPDGTKILFDGGPGFGGGGPSGIFVAELDGSGTIQLLSYGFSPVWSPDGSKIAFCSNHEGNYEIYSADANGTNIKRLTQNPASDYRPDWQ